MCQNYQKKYEMSIASSKDTRSLEDQEFFDKKIIMEIAGIIESNWEEPIVNSFGAMNLKDKLLRGIFTAFDKPSAIQQKGIVPMTKGRDVMIVAQSLTGKSIAACVGILQLIDVHNYKCQAIVLTSTRESAEKIQQNLKLIGSIMGAKSHLCIGGTIEKEEMRKLEQGVHVAIGMAVCIKDMIQRKFIITNEIKLLVLDEADELLSRGSKDDIMNVFLKLPKNLQVVATSTTFIPDMVELNKHLMRNQIQISVRLSDMNELKDVRQFYLLIKHEQLKVAALCELYDSLGFTQAIVFCNFRQKVSQLSEEMTAKSFTVAAIHEKMDHRVIEMALKQFRLGAARLLITTDFMARHKDVQQMALVINYDLPLKKDNYIHRVKRFGRKGVAINFVTDVDRVALQELQNHYHTNIGHMPENIADYI